MVRASRVEDFNTQALHDWAIEVSLLELRQMIDAAAGALGGADSSKVATALAPSLHSLLRLATECAAIAIVPGAATEVPVLLRNPNVDTVTKDILGYYQRCVQSGQSAVNLGFIAG